MQFLRTTKPFWIQSLQSRRVFSVTAKIPPEIHRDSQEGPCRTNEGLSVLSIEIII